MTVDFSAGNEKIRFYVDGRPAGEGTMNIPAKPSGAEMPLKIGTGNDDFPPDTGFVGEIDDVRWYGYVLSASMLGELGE